MARQSIWNISSTMRDYTATVYTGTIQNVAIDKCYIQSVVERNKISIFSPNTFLEEKNIHMSSKLDNTSPLF